MFKGDRKDMGVGRRDFIRTTTMASVAAALPATRPASRYTSTSSASRPAGMKKKLLFLSDNPKTYERFIESIKSIPGTDLLVSTIKVNYQKPEEIIRTIHEQNMDILLMCLSRFTFSFGSLYDSMGDLDIPVIVLSTNPQLILIDANLVASLRANGANVTFALSQDQALKLVKLVAAPGILEGRRAILYGKPFNSFSVPARNLTEDVVNFRK